MDDGWIEIFIDAAYKLDDACLASSAKNSSGTMLAWFQRDIISGLANVEVKAIYLALSLPVSKKCKKVHIISDSSSLVSALNNKSDVAWELDSKACKIGLGT